MRFIRPQWLTHGGEKKDFEVYSCHVSPDGTRLVTAAGDGHVRIWSTEAIYNAGEADYDKPRQLASMSYHSGTIHTVRFSSNRKFLASGADDKIVCVYALDPNPPSHAVSFGTNEAPPVENWRIFRRLIGHENDVQDLGWSNDSSILVSVGLDSKVVIWSGHTFEKLKTISSHQSHVKGLAFDPANKYFCTASDDRTIKVFRFVPPGPNSTAHDQANNFTLEKTISAPFLTSPLTTYFRRCSWSPDGQHIAAANATNGPAHSVAIVNRGSWDGDIHLIGHEAPVEVCAFSPRLFSKLPPEAQHAGTNGAPMAHTVTVIACAGQDRSLSIWITSNSRPLLITQDLAMKAMSDLAWTPDGRNLFMTSLDGSIILAMFSESELGYAVSMDENERTLAKFGGGKRGAGMVEGPAALFLEEKSKEGELKGVEGRMGALMGDGGASAATTNGKLEVPSTNGDAASPSLRPVETNGDADAVDPNIAKLERLKSRVTITKDGKKRITPLLVSTGTAESSLPRTQLVSSMANGAANANEAPQTILDLSRPFDGLPKGGLVALLFGNKRSAAFEESDAIARKQSRLALAGNEGAIPILSTATKDQASATTAANQAQATPATGTVPEFVRPAVTNPSLTVSQLRLAVPKIRAQISQIFGGGTNMTSKDAIGGGTGGASNSAASAPADTMFEVRNPTGPSPIGRADIHEPARVMVTRKGQPYWLDFLPKSILLITGNKDFWAAACEDGSLYCWTPAGKRIINPIILESQPVILDCKDKWLLCVTAVGLCYLWDIKTLSAPHAPVSLAPILDIAQHALQTHPTKPPALTSARLNSEGRIIVTLTNGEGFVYNPNMLIWQRVSEVWWAVGSQYWNTTDSSVGNLTSSSNDQASLQTASKVSAGIIPYLERCTTNETLARGRVSFLNRLIKQLLPREGYESFESNVSIAHLENRLAGALMLGAREEFRTYLLMYTKRLGAESLRGKIEELLRGLLEGMEDKDDEKRVEEGNNGGDRVWSRDTDMICGWKKEELLKEVILILGKHRDLQRVTVPYARLLGIVGDQPDDGNAMES
ncbi:HIR complex subunit [Agyrium rufum]|nr:HIR complex subunit [Agyrium rufum]